MDPRSMEPDELREVVRQTHTAMRHAWVVQAESFHRIQSEKLYKGYGFETWTEYIESDLPGLNERSIRQQVLSLGYAESTEMALIESVLNGSHEAGMHPRFVPTYSVCTSLSRLRAKTNKEGETGAVDKADYDIVHQKAFSGEWGIRQVKKNVRDLTIGITFQGANDENPDVLTVMRTGNSFAVAEDRLRSLKKMVKDKRMPVFAGRALRDRLILMLEAYIHVFGVEMARSLLRSAEGKERAKPNIGLISID